MATMIDSTGPRRILIREAVAWSIFPIVFSASHILTAQWISAGYQDAVVVTVFSALVAVILFALERIQPYAQQWRGPQDDVRTDVAHLLFSTMLVLALFGSLFRTALLVGAGWLAMEVGMQVWPSTWPWWSQLALVVAGTGGIDVVTRKNGCGGFTRRITVRLVSTG